MNLENVYSYYESIGSPKASIPKITHEEVDTMRSIKKFNYNLNIIKVISSEHDYRSMKKVGRKLLIASFFCWIAIFAATCAVYAFLYLSVPMVTVLSIVVLIAFIRLCVLSPVLYLRTYSSEVYQDLKYLRQSDWSVIEELKERLYQTCKHLDSLEAFAFGMDTVDWVLFRCWANPAKIQEYPEFFAAMESFLVERDNIVKNAKAGMHSIVV